MKSFANMRFLLNTTAFRLFCFVLFVSYSLGITNVKQAVASSLRTNLENSKADEQEESKNEAAEQEESKNEAAELKDVALFNEQSDKFIEALNEIKWTPFGVNRFVVPGQDIDEIVRSTTGMRDSLLAVRSSLEAEIRNASPEDADIAAKEEELQSLDSIATALRTFSAQFSATQTSNMAINIPEEAEPVIAPVFNFMESLAKLKLSFINAATLPFWEVLGLQNVGSLLGAPELFDEVVNTPNSLNIFQPESFGLFNDIPLEGSMNLLPTGETLKNMLAEKMPTKDSLTNIFTKSDLFNIFNLDKIHPIRDVANVLPVFDASRSHLFPIREPANVANARPAVLGFGKPDLLMQNFQEALLTLKKDVKGEAKGSLLLDDLHSLSKAVKSLDSIFFEETSKNSSHPAVRASNLETRSIIPFQALTLANTENSSSAFDSIFAVKVAFVQMFTDFMGDIINVQDSLELFSLDKVPKDVENQLQQLLAKGDKLAKPLAGLKNFEPNFIKEIVNGEESLLKKFATFEKLKKSALDEFRKISHFDDLLDMNFGAATRKLSDMDDIKKLLTLPDPSNNEIKNGITDVSGLLERFQPLDLTPEQLVDATKLFESFGVAKLEMLLGKLSALTSIPMALTGISTGRNGNNSEHSGVEEAYLMNFINFIKKFKDPRTLDLFMQKFNLLSLFVPNVSFDLSKNGKVSLNGLDPSPEKDLSSKPFTLLFLPELKQQFEKSLVELFVPGEIVTDNKLENAVHSTKKIIDLFKGVKSVTPLSPLKGDSADAGLLSATGLLELLKKNVIPGLEINPEEASNLKDSMAVALDCMKPANLLKLPLQQLVAATKSFLDVLGSLKQGLMKFASKTITPAIEPALKLVVSKGLVFLSAVNVFITTFLFLFVQAPVAIKLFLWELLMRSVEMPVSIGMSKEIFATVQFGGASEKLPVLEEASVKSKNLLSDVATRFLTTSSNSGSDDSAAETLLASKANLFKELFKMPFGFFNKSFDEKLMYDLMNESVLKGESVDVSDETLKLLDDTYNSVAKIEETLGGEQVSSSSSSSSTSLLRFFDIPVRDGDIARPASVGRSNLFSSLPISPLATLQQSLPQFPSFQSFPNVFPESLKQSFPPIPSLSQFSGGFDLSGVMGSVGELQRQALNSSAFGGVGEEANALIGDTIDRLGMRNVLRGIQ